jgi:penicillin-binding protein 1C
MHEKSWFILPPAQAWYYKRYNANYTEPPDYLAGCIPTASETMEMIYPKKFTKVFVPIEIDGQLGKVIFEAAHRNPRSKVFWYLDDAYVGETREIHQMGLFPMAGPHIISLVDDQGRELSVAFEAVNKRKL